jgi:hypothetical protein
MPLVASAIDCAGKAERQMSGYKCSTVRTGKPQDRSTAAQA